MRRPAKPTRRPSKKAPYSADSLVVSPRKAWEMLNCSNDHGYRLLAAGELESFLDGRLRKVTVASINSFIQRRIAASAGQVRRSPQPLRNPEKNSTFASRYKAARKVA